jgi:magnesium transporter
MRSLTEASLTQNEEVKKISSWAAILFAPTLVGAIYGMNFDHRPELHWFAGYPLELALMLITSITLYAVFKRRGWLYGSRPTLRWRPTTARFGRRGDRLLRQVDVQR